MECRCDVCYHLPKGSIRFVSPPKRPTTTTATTTNIFSKTFRVFRSFEFLFSEITVPLQFNRSENGREIDTDSLRRRGRKEASNFDRFGNDFASIFEPFSKCFLVYSASQKYRKTSHSATKMAYSQHQREIHRTEHKLHSNGHRKHGIKNISLGAHFHFNVGLTPSRADCNFGR